jgi:enamine deaminase RidA (YjgF/YER057c/UK114 family)
MKTISAVLAVAVWAFAVSIASAQTIQPVETGDAPPPGGHYSQAVIANGFVFIAGQLPIKPGGGHEIPAGIEAQRRQALF